MPRTLFLTGSLAPKAMRNRLSGMSGEVLVVEFDTLLDRTKLPPHWQWLSLRDLLDGADIKTVHNRVYKALDIYLRARPEIGDTSENLQLRKAAVNGVFMDAIFTRWVNDLLFQRLRERFEWSHMVAAAGCGVHFEFWRTMAGEHGFALETLQPEPVKRGLRRWLERFIHKRRARRRPASSPPTPVAAEHAPADGPLVFCVSRRCTRLLMSEKPPRTFQVRHLDMQALGAPDPDFLSREKARFAQWWASWQENAPATASQEEREILDVFGSLYQEMGSRFSGQVYPLWSALRRNAQAILEKERPDAVLADTQLAESECVWTLAAKSLGIPVVTYSYDQTVNTRVMNPPDYVLVDGMRSIPRSLENGYPEERLIQVAGHRRPKSPRRSRKERDLLFSGGKPVVLFADPMSVISDPQTCMRCYRSVVEAARLLPGLRFIIKFHPLRAAKSELRSFVGMDESEVRAKRRCILSMRPPRNVSLLAPEADMEECLKTCAVLLNTTSMSGHEAFHMGIPVVFLIRHARDSITFPELVDRMSMLCADNGHELADALNLLFNSRQEREAHVEAQRRYLDDFYWPSDRTLVEGVECALQKLGIARLQSEKEEQPCI